MRDWTMNINFDWFRRFRAQNGKELQIILAVITKMSFLRLKHTVYRFHDFKSQVC